MTEGRILDIVRQLMVTSEDDSLWVLAAATDEELMHVRSCVRDTMDRVNRELTRRA